MWRQADDPSLYLYPQRPSKEPLSGVGRLKMCGNRIGYMLPIGVLGREDRARLPEGSQTRTSILVPREAAFSISYLSLAGSEAD